MGRFAAFFLTLLAWALPPSASAIEGVGANGLNDAGFRLSVTALLADYRDILVGMQGSQSKLEVMKALHIQESVTSQIFAIDYEANEIAGDEKYKGKRFALAGEVLAISKDATGSAYVVFRGKAAFHDVHARLAQEAVSEAARLRKGQRLTLVCEGGAKIMVLTVASRCMFPSQYVEKFRATVATDTEAFLTGRKPWPKAKGEAVTLFYALGVSLPPDAPCLKAVEKCDAIFPSLRKDSPLSAKVRGVIEGLRPTLKLS